MMMMGWCWVQRPGWVGPVLARIKTSHVTAAAAAFLALRCAAFRAGVGACLSLLLQGWRSAAWHCKDRVLWEHVVT